MSRVQMVVEAIKQMIVTGELQPGDRLAVESEIAARVGVSRNTLREGVRVLTMQGVLQPKQGDGTYVTSLQPDVLFNSLNLATELQALANPLDTLAVRRVLETEAAGLAARAWTEELDVEAQAAIDEADTILRVTPDEQRLLIEADRKFHAAIARGSRNSVLSALVSSVGGRTIPSRLQRGVVDHDASARSLDEHRGILQAVSEGNDTAARIRMSAHILAVEDFVKTLDRPQHPRKIEVDQ